MYDNSQPTQINNLLELRLRKETTQYFLIADSNGALTYGRTGSHNCCTKWGSAALRIAHVLVHMDLIYLFTSHPRSSQFPLRFHSEGTSQCFTLWFEYSANYTFTQLVCHVLTMFFMTNHDLKSCLFIDKSLFFHETL